MLAQEIRSLIPDYVPFCKLVDGRYRQIMRLGKGRYGKVHLCLDMQEDRLVAMKTLQPDHNQISLRNFLTEIMTLARINSFNAGLKTPQVLNFNFQGSDESGQTSVYYVMDFIEMGELYSVFYNGGLVSERLACFFFRQLVDGLVSLHSHNLVHLDIKPENVLVDSWGNLYLCDFGSAAFIFKDDASKQGAYELPIRPDVQSLVLSPTNSMVPKPKTYQSGPTPGQNPKTDILRTSTDSNPSRRKKANSRRIAKPVWDTFKQTLQNFSPKDFELFLKNARFCVTSEYAAPEIARFSSFQEALFQSKSLGFDIEVANPSKLDVFSLGVLLFYMVLKAMPFVEANQTDEYYKRLVHNREAFWKIFEKIRTVTREFKEIISDTLQLANKSRSDLLSLSSHSWVLKNFPSEDQYFRLLAHTNSENRCFRDFGSSGEGSDGYAHHASEENSDDRCHYSLEDETGWGKGECDPTGLIQELRELLADRRKVFLQQLTTELNHKKEKYKTKRVKKGPNLKTNQNLTIQQFIERNHRKLLILQKHLQNKNVELLEGLISSEEESSSSSGDGR